MALFGGEESLNIIVRLKDEASEKLESLSKEFDKVSKGLEPAISASNKFAIGLTAMATAAGVLGLSAIKSAGDMQALTIGLTATMGSAKLASEEVEKLRILAKDPGLSFKQVIDGSNRLQIAGLSAEQARKTIKEFGNAMASVGNTDLSGVVLALGQIQGKGKIFAEEINQINERVPQIRVAMQKAFGTSDTKALQDMGISSEEFIRKVTEQFATLPRAANGFNNAVVNLQDAWEQFLMNQGAKILDWAQKFIDVAAVIVSDVLPKWVEKAQTLAIWLSEHKVVLAGLVGVIAGGLTMAVYGLVAAFAAMLVTLAPFMLAGGALFMLIEGIREGNVLMTAIAGGILSIFIPSLITLATTLWTTVIPAFAALAIEFAPFILGGLIIAGVVAGILWVIKNWDYLRSEAEITMAAIAILWKDMWGGFSKAVDTIWEGIKSSISASVNWVLDKVNAAINAMNSLSSFGASLFGLGNSAVRLPNIPKLADGGIVNSPTLAMIGEAGPEAVVPLSQMGGMGGGVTITINNPSFNSREDEDRLMRTLDKYFRPLAINNKL